MKLKELMTQSVRTCEPSASVKDVAIIMRDEDIGALPVCSNDRLVGLVTDRDIVVRAAAEGKDINGCKVSDVMSQGIQYCFDDQDVQEAAQMMKSKQIRRLAVLNRDKRLVGIVSLGDLAVQTGDASVSGETLEKVSQPTKAA